MKPREQAIRFGEFVALMALMMSLVALSIDAMLPALPQIAGDLVLSSGIIDPIGRLSEVSG